MTPTERAIALMIFLRFWNEDPEDMEPERVDRLILKWEQQWMPSLEQPHCGDCTNVAAPCTRCHTEEVIENAKRIAAVIA